VEAPGIENDQSHAADTIGQRKGSIGVRGISANVPDRASKCAIDRRDVTESSGRTAVECGGDGSRAGARFGGGGEAVGCGDADRR